MFKVIRRILIAGVAVLIVFGVFQWHVYEQKTKQRQDALLYFHEEDYSKTIQYLKEALQSHSLFAENLDYDMTCYMAESYYQLGKYEEAVEIYDQLLKSKKNISQNFVLKGECYKAAKEYDKAISVFESGWKNTKDTGFLKKICGIYIEQKEYEKALTYAEKGAREGGSSKADFLYQTIAIYEQANEYDAAYKAAKKYCDLYPEDKKARKEFLFLSTRI